MKRARQIFEINPARSYACGDEYSDYLAAINAGMHPFVVSYGFEDNLRLIKKFNVPSEVISKSPAEFENRLLNALNLSIEEHVLPKPAKKLMILPHHVQYLLVDQKGSNQN
jgi:phosphoglycolate phosphatase